LAIALAKSKVEEIKDLKKSKIQKVEVWRNRRFEEVEDSRGWSSKKSKIEEVKDWRSQRIEEVEDLNFGDSTRVCDSSRVSGPTDVGMPFRYPRISIPGSAH
jgi:hypothetical protein